MALQMQKNRLSIAERRFLVSNVKYSNLAFCLFTFGVGYDEIQKESVRFCN